jgi:hypothetical protein
MQSWQQVKHFSPTEQQIELIRKAVRFFKVSVKVPATREEAAKLIHKFEMMH